MDLSKCKNIGCTAASDSVDVISFPDHAYSRLSVGCGPQKASLTKKICSQNYISRKLTFVKVKQLLQKLGDFKVFVEFKFFLMSMLIYIHIQRLISRKLF